MTDFKQVRAVCMKSWSIHVRSFFLPPVEAHGGAAIVRCGRHALAEDRVADALALFELRTRSTATGGRTGRRGEAVS